MYAESIDNWVLHALANSSKGLSLLRSAPSPPAEEATSAALVRLRAWGFLEDNVVTKSGKKASKMMRFCSLDAARFILEAEKKNCVPDAIKIAAILQRAEELLKGGTILQESPDSGPYANDCLTLLELRRIYNQGDKDKTLDYDTKQMFYEAEDSIRGLSDECKRLGISGAGDGEGRGKYWKDTQYREDLCCCLVAGFFGAGTGAVLGGYFYFLVNSTSR